MALLDIGLNVQPGDIAPLTRKLAEYNYLEEPISKLLGRWDISELNGKEYPNYLFRCDRDGSDLARLVAIFLMGRATDRETLVGYLGEALVDALKSCGLLLEYKGQWASHVVIYPCLGRYILTDHWVGTGKQTPGKVYELGPDSYALARVTPRRGVKRALDLCTGSGVHAVLSAAVAEISIAVDINPRALDLTTINAALNGVSVETHLADLYSAVKGQKFDLITANPPFVPSPDPDVLIHRSAGESGEEVPERLVAGLPDHLEQGGLFSMVLDHPVYAHETYLDRLERWLGEKQGWGIAVLTFAKVTLPNYIMGHLQGVEKYDEAFKQYLESYLRLGIESMEFANVFIMRLDRDEPNWKVEQACPAPNTALVPKIAEWLDCQRLYHARELQLDPNCRPRLSSNYIALWRDWTHTRGVVENAEDNPMTPELLNSDEAELLQLMQPGTLTVSELLEALGPRERFEEAFRGLGRRRILDGVGFLVKMDGPVSQESS